MELFNSLIAILTIKILFLKVDIWHVNANPSVNDFHSSFTYGQILFESNDTLERINSECKQIISQKQSHHVPYTINTKPNTKNAFFQNKIGLNDAQEFRATSNMKCCEGYVLSGSSRKICVPRCPRSCQKGTCMEPDVCTCNRGYRMSNNSCVPECTNGCVNGTCVEPEICSCNEGYWMDSDGITCKPVCHTSCEKFNSYCSEPNVCACKPGYRRIGDDSSPLTCEPICDRTCSNTTDDRFINGICEAPNLCRKCLPGFWMEKSSPYRCKSMCDEPCVFGTCQASGKCSCNHGYRAVNASVCEPICSEPCIMGTCVAPETCECNEGYRQRNKSVCEPICNDSLHGKCAAPEVSASSCEKGFIYDKINGTCKPYCHWDCGPNGKCTAPDSCTCFKGYSPILNIFYLMHVSGIHSNGLWLPISRRKPRSPIYLPPVCRPVCNFTCINGDCTAPNVCTCRQGYYPTWILNFHRSPIYHNKLHVCEALIGPHCASNESSCGSNGTCHKSGVCICNTGYARDTDGFCVPFCDPKCLNGSCTAPNRCECYDGFALRNDSFCEPICDRDCQNGDCIGPNHCVCHDNFIPNVNHSGPECIPVCTRNCSGHGECITEQDYKCECHFGWTGEDCEVPTMCVITMAYDHNDDRMTIDIVKNSTIIRAFENAPYCDQCNSFDNETSCYVVQRNKNNMTNVDCLLSTDLPCYTTFRDDASINDSTTTIVWPFVITIIIVTGLTVSTYLLYKKHQKKKSPTGTSTIFVRETFSTDFLLPDI